IAQALWNAKIDPRKLTRHWASHHFGPAAKPMEAYYFMMQRAWLNSPKPLRRYFNQPATFVKNFISQSLLAKAHRYFQTARQNLNKVKSDSARQKFLAQINLEAAILSHWRKVYNLQQGIGNYLSAKAPKAALTPEVSADKSDPAWEKVLPLPDYVNSRLQPAKNKTQTYLQWDKNSLYLRFVSDAASDSAGNPITILLSDSKSA